MDNFFNYITKNLDPEEVDVWFRVNDIIPEKMELYYDLSYSLFLLIKKTYLGDIESSNETKIEMSEEDNKKHFDWCWKKTLESFSKENVNFKKSGEHRDYFENFFFDTFYNQKEKNLKDAIPFFLSEVFQIDKPFSKSDLDILTELYKLLEKNLES